jgi:hypothetical protein
MSRPLTRAALAALAGTLALAAPAAAQSGSAPTATAADGQTMLRLDTGTARALTGAGIRVSLIRPARAGASGLTFPVTGGEADPQTLAGTVNHSGGFAFRAGDTTVRLRSLRYRIGARSSLSARIGSARVTILRLDTRRARITRAGQTTSVRNVSATLTAAAARALNAAFATDLFRAGLRIGTVRSEVEFGTVALDGGATDLALAPTAVEALTALGIAATPVAPSAALSFAITDGELNPRTLAGEIEHSGGIALAREAVRVELRDFVITIDDQPRLSAQVGANRLDIATLDVSGLQRQDGEGTVTLSNVVARLTPAAAGALNALFTTTAFTEGAPLGTATVRAELR